MSTIGIYGRTPSAAHLGAALGQRGHVVRHYQSVTDLLACMGEGGLDAAFTVVRTPYPSCMFFERRPQGVLGTWCDARQGDDRMIASATTAVAETLGDPK